jgi:hypothetical protein
VWRSVVASGLWRRGGRKDIIILRTKCCVVSVCVCVCVKNRVGANTISRFGDFIPLFIYCIWTNSRITGTRCNRTDCTTFDIFTAARISNLGQTAFDFSDCFHSGLRDRSSSEALFIRGASRPRIFLADK